MNFLEKLDMLMQHKGYKKSDLAKVSGIPYTTIDAWYKKGFDGVRLSSLRKLSDCLGVSLGFWIDGDDSEDEIEAKKEPPAPEGAEDGHVSVEEIEALIPGLVRMGYVRDISELTKEDFLFINQLLDLAHTWFSRKR